MDHFHEYTLSRNIPDYPPVALIMKLISDAPVEISSPMMEAFPEIATAWINFRAKGNDRAFAG